MRAGWTPVTGVTPDLSVRLFGGVRVSYRGEEVALASRPAAALLALLVIRRRPWAREEIAAAIWPEAGYGSSGRLRQALWLLRKGFAAAGADPADVLAADEDTVALRPGIGPEVDAERFEMLVRRRPPDPEAAIALYDGDFAEGLGLECILARREFLANLYEDALASVARARLVAGDADGARTVAYRLLERDPLREDAHAVLMEAFAVIGSRSQVHRHYRHLRALLARELAAEPLAETSAAYRNALAGIEARSAARARVAAGGAGVPGLDRAMPVVGVDIARVTGGAGWLEAPAPPLRALGGPRLFVSGAGARTVR